MDKKDLDAIKLGGPAFTRKWWDAHRGVTMKDAGVGKALEDWVRYCPRDPELIEDIVALEVATDTCERLTAALTKARQSCGPLAKDSKLGCDRYLALVEDYRKRLVSAAADPLADAETWKKILDLKPRVFSDISKTEDRIVATIKALGELAESARYLGERAKARNQVSSAHGGRDDLMQALELLKKAMLKHDHFINREATHITTPAGPLLDLADTLKTRRYDKEMRVIHDALLKSSRKEGELRDRYTDLSVEVQQVEKLVTQAVKTRQQVMDVLETRMTIFWDGPQSGENLAHSIAGADKALSLILATDIASLTEDDKRKLRQKVRDVDAERRMIDAGMTNLGNTIRQAAFDTRDYAKDKDVAAKLKEMLLALQQLQGSVKQLDGKADQVSKLIARM